MYRLSLFSALAFLLIWQTSSTSADPDDASNYTNADCRQVGSATDKCLFSKTADSCAIDEGFVNYIQVVFCNLSSVVPIGIIVFILWWLFLFLALAVTADDFFCPSLTVMSKVLRMSDNIAISFCHIPLAALAYIRVHSEWKLVIV
ncbi:hypothetical protein EB796_021745 [Bugula neritina]|uniref:Uncharacterized protein n=1 Tax=Bugula neritina TaxID=10212 RepID=A0A7J7J1H2_BUGNE|nr:hypothetical protein EB796_021745 [Bugula neritina]